MGGPEKGLRIHSNLTCDTIELPISKPYQPRRTGVVLSQTIAPRFIGIGIDTSGLERWTWTRLRGRDRAITIILAFRPCKPSTAGVQTVYAQHTRTLLIKQEPRQKFQMDLKDCIQTHQEQGDIIILGMKLNDPVQRYDITKYFEELYTKEAILSIHRGHEPPATNILNESQYTIDRIWCSIGLTARSSLACPCLLPPRQFYQTGYGTLISRNNSHEYRLADCVRHI